VLIQFPLYGGIATMMTTAKGAGGLTVADQVAHAFVSLTSAGTFPVVIGFYSAAGMAQLDDDIGLVMKKLKDIGVDDNTIVVFTTDNGTEVFTWPDGGQTPFAQSKGTVLEGGFRVPAMIRWPGHVPADSVQNGIFSGLDWLPTFAAAAGNPNLTEELLKGKTIGDRTYKNHLDGYNQLAAITGKGPSARHEIFYLGESTVGAVRIDDYKYRFIDQPAGWLGEKTHPDVPYITNLRRTRSSARAGPATERKTAPSNISIGSSTNSGASCSSRRWLARSSRLSSITRRCSGAPASTSTQSRRR
jgi:hypothetical protein